MKAIRNLFLVVILAPILLAEVQAQTNVSTQTNLAVNSTSPVNSPRRANSAMVPVPREGKGLARQKQVLDIAKNSMGTWDVMFVGDSITEGWEGPGKEVWKKFYGNRKCLNFAVDGDRIENVLWRFANGQLDDIRPKVTVLMIGTNNSNKDENSEFEILEGIIGVISELVERCPDTKILVMGIFPRGQTFNAQRGKIAQINQALAKAANGGAVHYMDITSQLLMRTGSISKDIMPDYLHLSEMGYTIWAEAIESKVKELLSIE